MYTDMCPVCKNKFSSQNKYIEGDSQLSSHCIPRKISKHINKDKKRPARTSTPIQELENSAPTSFSDSVSDFFYQTWKSGLHSNDTMNSQERHFNPRTQPNTNQQPTCNATHVVFVSTVIFQPYIPQYVQQVGYRPDGTFGVLPMYWPYNGYLL